VKITRGAEKVILQRLEPVLEPLEELHGNPLDVEGFVVPIVDLSGRQGVGFKGGEPDAAEPLNGGTKLVLGTDGDAPQYMAEAAFAFLAAGGL